MILFQTNSCDNEPPEILGKYYNPDLYSNVKYN